MKRETFLKIKKHRRDLKQRINAGEVHVCNSARPMPEDRDCMGQMWYHEEAKPEGEAYTNNGVTMQPFRCPACGTLILTTSRPV